MIVTVITSWLFVIVNVGSYITDVCSFPKPNEYGIIPSDWTTHQLILIIIYDLATQHHIKFNSLTFFSMLRAHIRHLKKLGAEV